MSNVYSYSIEGIHNAEIALERAARKIAIGREPEGSYPGSRDTVEISTAGLSAASASAGAPVDYAAEIIAIKQAETALEANLRAFASQRDLERVVLDLFA